MTVGSLNWFGSDVHSRPCATDVHVNAAFEDAQGSTCLCGPAEGPIQIRAWSNMNFTEKMHVIQKCNSCNTSVHHARQSAVSRAQHRILVFAGKKCSSVIGFKISCKAKHGFVKETIPRRALAQFCCRHSLMSILYPDQRRPCRRVSHVTSGGRWRWRGRNSQLWCQSAHL